MGQSSIKPKLTRGDIRQLQRFVSFSEEEIQDWHKEFCQSGVLRRNQDDPFLSEEEFVKVYNSVYPGQCDEFVRHVFRTFDIDGDNRVDFKEFLIGLSFSGSSDLHKQLAWAFQVYDVNRSGFITKDNMTQIIRAVFKMIGHQSVTETPEAMADNLFHVMDKDGDDRISWREFCDGALNNPMVLQLLQCSPPDSAGPASSAGPTFAFT